MADLIIGVKLEAVELIAKVIRDNGRIPWMNETVAREGYQNVMIAIADPTLFSHTITLMAVEDGSGFDGSPVEQGVPNG